MALAMLFLPMLLRTSSAASSTACSVGSKSSASLLQTCSFSTEESRSKAWRALRSATAVCFDVDSTVITEEGIDALAEYKGVGEKVAELTNSAMSGGMLFQDALAARLEIIKPSRNDVHQFLAQRPPELSKGINEVVNLLHSRNVSVYLVSGGFRQMIEPVASMLGIPFHRIYANNLLFEDDVLGTYKGFDDQEPTSRDGGKPKVVKTLLEAHGYSPIVMVGDGVTDMQARPPADAFIGYGGVVKREKVQTGADWFITDFQEMLDALNSEEK